MQMASRLNLQMIDCWQRNGEIDKILKYTDTILLRDGLGLSEKEIGLLHDIWEKLHNRRMTRKISASVYELVIVASIKKVI